MAFSVYQEIGPGVGIYTSSYVLTNFRGRHYRQNLATPHAVSPFSYIQENAVPSATGSFWKVKPGCFVE